MNTKFLKLATVITKKASPWLRRLRGMSPKQLKRVPLTPTLLNLIDDDTKLYSRQISALDAYKNPDTSLAFKETPIDAARYAIEYRNVPRARLDSGYSGLGNYLERAQKRFPGQFNNLYDLARLAKKPLGNAAFERKMAKQYLEELGLYLKEIRNHKNDLKNLESQRLIGKPLTYDDFIVDNPEGQTLFKGGQFAPESWLIYDPGWASGRLSVAESYALSPTMHSGQTDIPTIHTAPIQSSKSLRTGKNFFTGHVSERGKNDRRIANHLKKYWHAVATPTDAYPNYETVINGNEMRNMPWRTYQQIIPKDLKHLPVKKILQEQITPGDIGIKFQQINPSLEPEIELKKRKMSIPSAKANNLRVTIKERFENPNTGYDMANDPLLETKPELPFWERNGLKDLLLYFGGSHGAKYGEI